MGILTIILCVIGLIAMDKWEWYSAEREFKRFNEMKEKYPDNPSMWWD